MKLLNFLKQESSVPFNQVAFMSIVTGLSTGVLLSIVNHAADSVSSRAVTTQYFFMYLIAFFLFLYAQRYSLSESAALIEDAIANLRTRLSNKLRKVDLSFFEKKGENVFYNRLSNDNALLSQSIPHISWGMQMAAIVVFSVIYMAFISMVSFSITVIGIAVGSFYFLSLAKKLKQSRMGIINYETEYFGSISHLLSGFKEVKINQAKSDSLYETIAKNAEETKVLKTNSAKSQAKIGGAGRIVVFSLLPILIFIVPVFSHEQTLSIYKITASMLFMYGPIGILFETIPLFSQINVVLDDLYSLEKEIDDANHQGIVHSEISYADFNEIKIDNLFFSYPKQKDSDVFSLGPITETIKAGELLFIIGGNGSGKSTFLKLLVGLYYPTQGAIYVDDKLIADESYQDYRNLFSIIFTDFHLFDRLYGVEGVEDEKVEYWLKKMHMDRIVHFKDGRFTNTDLSTGQRKRLAFVAAIMENKPILILDEFAADQDPNFRKYFYEVILKELKEMGKTVIAVTHDDHYFHVPDRVLKMDSAQLFKYNPDEH